MKLLKAKSKVAESEIKSEVIKLLGPKSEVKSEVDSKAKSEVDSKANPRWILRQNLR